MVHGQFASLAACNDQVISSIAVQIEPRDARAELTQTIGQEWLTREVVEQFFMMFVSQPFADIFKHRLRFGVGSWQLEVGSFFGAWSLELGVCRFRPRLSDFVKVIRLAIVYDAPRAAAPAHFDDEVGRAAGGKDSHRIVAGHVTTATDDFLALCHRSAINFDFCSDALWIGRFAAQTHGESRRRGFIAVNQCRTVQTIDHDIQVAVIVQVSQSHPVGDFG